MVGVYAAPSPSENRLAQVNRDKLLSNHAIVLLYVAKHPSATQIEIARAVGITQAYTGVVIRDLIKAGMLSCTRKGARNVYRVNREAQFKHPVISGRSVADFAKALGVRLQAHAARAS